MPPLLVLPGFSGDFAVALPQLECCLWFLHWCAIKLFAAFGKRVGQRPTFFAETGREIMRLKEALQKELAAIVRSEGLELLEMEVVGSGSKTVVRLIVDGPAGVTLDQCAKVSRQASAFLDVEDPFSHTYTLEVSSPGIERKLYSKADYHRFAGHRVKVRMKPEFRQHRVVVGELLGIEDGVVRVMNGEGESVELPLEQVFESRLQVDWQALMRERKCRL